MFLSFWERQTNTNANAQFSYSIKSLRTPFLWVNKIKSAAFKDFRYFNPFKIQCYETLYNIHSLLNYYFIKLEIYVCLPFVSWKKFAFNILFIKAIPFSSFELFPLRVTKRIFHIFLSIHCFFPLQSNCPALFLTCIKLVLTDLVCLILTFK